MDGFDRNEWSNPSGIRRLFREIAELGYTGSRRSVRRFLSTIRPKQERVYKPVETLPGEQAQVDWGHEKAFDENGRPVDRYSFNFILSHSRVRYVEYTSSQDMATFLACHERAFRYIGGCPREIVYDNCKTVVAERIGDRPHTRNEEPRSARLASSRSTATSTRFRIIWPGRP